MKKPKISVWLTSYNHEQYIKESIESILAQTYTDYELLIIDDCSSDSSWNIIQEYEKKDARIRAIRHPYNQGSSGLCDMLDELNGEYVAIAHCDDAWKPDKLEKQVKVLEKNDNIVACFTLVDVIDDAGNIVVDGRNPYCKIFEQPNRTRYEWLNYFFYNGNRFCHPSLLIRKEAYTEMSILTKGLNGLPDYCQWIRLCKKAEIHILQERLTRFRVHGDGSNTSGENAQSIIRVHNEEWLVLREFLDLIDTNEVTEVFPETKQYIVDGKICEKYALARVMFNHPKSSYKLFGLQLLYELFQDEEQEQKICQLYGYTRKDFDRDKKKYDVFHVIPDNRYLQVNIYLGGENGYSEERKVVASAFVQQTGAFTIRVDLSSYTPSTLECIRVDLDEGKYRKFKIFKCKCAEESIEYRPINGMQQGEWDTFYTIDPQYEFHLTKGGWLCIEGFTEEISGAEVEQYYNRIQHQCDALNEEISRMKTTKIWKMGMTVKRLLRK